MSQENPKLKLVINLKKDDSGSSPTKQTIPYTPSVSSILGESSIGLPRSTEESQNKNLQDAIPLDSIIIRATQRAFRQLESLYELMEQMSDAERKSALLEYSIEYRSVFAKILCVLEWRNRFNDINSIRELCEKIKVEKAMPLTELADRLCAKHFEYARIACPLYNIPRALEVLHPDGFLSGFPGIIRDFGSDNLSETMRERYLSRLDRLVRVYLAKCSFNGAHLTDLSDGVAKLLVMDGEVMLRVCLVPGADMAPRWFLLSIDPVPASAASIIGNSLTGMLQQKYNSRGASFSFLQDISSDLRLYRCLYCLHQLFVQFTELKQTVALKIEHSVGQVKISFYPKQPHAQSLSIKQDGSDFSVNCSWNPTLSIIPSFDCSNWAIKILDDAHHAASIAAMSRIGSDMDGYCDIDNGRILFTFSSVNAELTVDRPSGNVIGTLTSSNGKSLLRSENPAMMIKRTAAEQYIASIDHPNITFSLPTTELSKLGSHPKTVIRLTDRLCLSIGLDPTELKLSLHLLFIRTDPHHSFLSLISQYESIPCSLSPLHVNDWDDLINSLDTEDFNFCSSLTDLGISYSLASQKEAVIHSLPRHLPIKEIVFRSDRSCRISLTSYLLPLQANVIQFTCSSFEQLLFMAGQYCKALLLIAQCDENLIGTVFPMNIMFGNHSLTMDDNGEIMIDGVKTSSVSLHSHFSLTSCLFQE